MPPVSVMNFVMKKFVLFASVCSLATSLLAQTIIEPEMGEVEYSKLQATDGTDGDLVSERVVRSFKAIVPANQEVWIPLGHFEWGELHKLIVAAKGNSSQSNAEVTFSSSWAGHGTAIRTLNQYSGQGRFRLYWRPMYQTGFGTGISVFMKYKNVSSLNNTVRIEHQGLHYASWRPDELIQEDIDNAIEMKGKIELQTGYTNYADYNLIRGTYLNDNVSVNGSLNVNGESVLTASALNSLPSIGIGGASPSNSLKIYGNKSIASFAPYRDLENGALIVQGGGGTKLAIDSNEIVGSQRINYATLAPESYHSFKVPAAGNNHRDIVAKFGLLDSNDRGVLIGNATYQNDKMAPNIVGYVDDSSVPGLTLTGAIQSTVDSGSRAVIDLAARTFSRAGEPISIVNNQYGPLQNRDVLNVRNHSNSVMNISPKGKTTLTNTDWENGSASGDEGFGLDVEGNASVQGDLVVEGTLKLSAPQGDISMGIFGE